MLQTDKKKTFIQVLTTFILFHIILLMFLIWADIKLEKITI